VIPKNAITMRGHIDRCWLLAYRVPIDQVAGMLPKPLSLVTKDGYAFLNLVVSHLRQMRPKPLPAWTGFSYWHVAYRLYVRFDPPSDAPIEGLYFLRSDVDSRLMAVLGNALTDFRLNLAQVNVECEAKSTLIQVESRQAPLRLWVDPLVPAAAPNSPFATLEEAADFLTYKPAGISVDGRHVNVLRIKRDEAAWRSRLVAVREQRVEFFKGLDAVLEVAYEVEPIDYQWNRAERWPR